MPLSRITAASIADGTVVAADIADGAVTGPKLGATSINANNIVAEQITGNLLAATTITGDKVALVSLSGNVIVANTITTNLFSSTIYASNSDIMGISANANTFGNTIIIVAGNTSSISVGDIVTGANVFPDTTVLSFNSPPSNRSNITVSKALAGSNTNTAVQFYSSRKILSPGIAGPGLCKAWVNFNGTGAVQIRAAYNVSSITDHGTGSYSLNFTTAMADADYAPTAMSGPAPNNDGCCISFNDATTGGSLGTGTNPTTSALRIAVFRTSDITKFDVPRLCVAIFR